MDEYRDMEKGLHERDRVGVQDSVLLEDYRSEQAFVDNLHKRFKHNLIYTYIGQVLVSVNPYKNLPIYDQATIGEYQNTHFYEVPPHIKWKPKHNFYLIGMVFDDPCIPNCRRT